MADAFAAVVYGERAFENVGEERHLVDVPAGFGAGRHREKRRRDNRRTVGISDLLADDRLAAGKQRRHENLRGWLNRRYCLGACRARGDQAGQKGSDCGEPLRHHSLHTNADASTTEREYGLVKVNKPTRLRMIASRRSS